MAYLIITIILFLVSFALLGCKATNNDLTWKFRPRQLFACLAGVVLLFGSFVKIPANNVGIVYSAFGGTSQYTLSEGYRTKSIFDKVYKISTETQTKRVENLTTQTKDAQFLTTQLDIQYRVSEQDAYLVFKQYRTLKNLSEQLIVPTAQRTLELITTKYNVIDILGESRSSVYAELELALREEFAEYGVEFKSISIVDMDAGEALEKAISDEAVAKKAVETAEQNLLKAQTEAKQQSVKAQAEQDAAKIKAETQLIEAEAEKKANELLSESITDEILQKEWIAKWDGQMPTYYGGSEGGAGIIVDFTEG